MWGRTRKLAPDESNGCWRFDGRSPGAGGPSRPRTDRFLGGGISPSTSRSFPRDTRRGRGYGRPPRGAHRPRCSMSSARLRTRHLALAGVFVVVLAVGCASTSKSKVHTTPAGPEQRFSMVGSGLQTTAVISKSGAQGPQVDIGRFDDGRAIRGTVDGR